MRLKGLFETETSVSNCERNNISKGKWSFLFGRKSLATSVLLFCYILVLFISSHCHTCEKGLLYIDILGVLSYCALGVITLLYFSISFVIVEFLLHYRQMQASQGSYHLNSLVSFIILELLFFIHISWLIQINSRQSQHIG